MAGDIVGEAVVLLRTLDQGVESQVKRSVDNAVQKAKADVKIGADTREAEEKAGGLRGLIDRIRGRAKADLDTKDAETSATRLGTAVEAVAGRAKQALGSIGLPVDAVGGHLDKLTGKATDAGAALKTGLVGGALAVGAALAVVGVSLSNFLRTAQQVDDLQDVLGGTAEEASKLRNIGAALGIEMNTLGNSIFKVSQNLEKQPELFAKWGVEIARNSQGSTDLYGTLLNLADAYNRIEDPQQRNVFLMETLGRSGKALIDVLAQGSENLRKFAEAGPILNEKQVKDAENFRIALNSAKDAAANLGVELGGRTAPTITQVINSFTGFIRAVDGATERSGFLSRSIGNVADSFKSTYLPFLAFGENSANAAKAQEELKLRVQDTVEQLQAEREELDRVAEAQLEAINTTVALEHGQRNFEKAVEDAAAKQTALNEAIITYGADSEQARAAADALKDSNLSLKDAALDLAEKTAAARANQEELNGAQLSGADRASIFRGALIDVANTVEDPLRTQLLALADNIRTLPDKTVRIDLDDANARAKIAGLRSFLFDETITKTVQVNYSVAQGALPAGYRLPGQQHGGPLVPGQDVLVGEAGPERIRWTPQGAMVEPIGTRSVGGGPAVVVYNNFGPGSDARSIEQATPGMVASLERVADRIRAGAGSRG